MKKSPEEFLEEMGKFPRITVLDKYVHSSVRLLCRCSQGHEWYALPGHLLRGHGCPHCAGQIRTPEDFLRDMAKYPEIEVLEPYLNSKILLLCRCKRGHEWRAWPSHLLHGHGCRKCKWKGPDNVCSEQLYARALDLVEGQKTKGVLARYEFRCLKHGIFEQVFHAHEASIRSGNNGCPECAKEKIAKIHKTVYPGGWHEFPCGCSGVLPEAGKSNSLAVSWHNFEGFMCRVTAIVKSSRHAASLGKYKPMDSLTPHSVVRDLMRDPLCWLCKNPLLLTFEMGKAPHLHHNHITGEIYGFTHPRCNMWALEDEVYKLRAEIKNLKEKYGTSIRKSKRNSMEEAQL